LIPILPPGPVVQGLGFQLFTGLLKTLMAASVWKAQKAMALVLLLICLFREKDIKTNEKDTCG